MLDQKDDNNLDDRRIGSGGDKTAHARINYHEQAFSMSQASRGFDERKGSFNDLSNNDIDTILKTNQENLVTEGRI